MRMTSFFDDEDAASEMGDGSSQESGQENEEED